jgi:hypothetical protein
MLLRLLAGLTILLTASTGFTQTAAQTNATRLIGWLLDEDHDLTGVPFSAVIQATSGRRVIPFDRSNAVDRALLEKIGGSLDKVLARVNQPDYAAQKQKRINEASGHFETAVKEELNAVAGFSCDVPHTAAGAAQRSGYPDLRLVDKTSGRVVYLDPKLYDAKSRASSLRTFYFTPRKETNKVNDDAHHLIVGFPHGDRVAGRWEFTGWELVDLAQFKVRLKAEFQASNRDLYREDAVVGRSGGKR